MENSNRMIKFRAWDKINYILVPSEQIMQIEFSVK